MPGLTILLVAIAGALGALSRVGLTEVVGGDVLAPTTLAITLGINTLGALALSLLRRVAHLIRPAAMIQAIGVGFLGAFTTWSAVIAASALAYGAGQTLLALSYLALTLILGIGIALLARGPQSEVSR